MRNGKYQKKREPIVNVAMTAALVMFWLVIITTYLSAGLFAKYSTKDDGGDKARVIKFGQVTVKEEKLDANNSREFIFTPGVPIEKEVTVSFDGSEADTYVFIKLDTPGWTRSGDYGFVLKDETDATKEIMSWSVDGFVAETNPDGWTAVPGTENVYYTFLDSNTPMNEKRVIKGDAINVPKSTRSAYAALAGVTLNINVTAYVVQAHGFESVQAAWASLQAKEVQP